MQAQDAVGGGVLFSVRCSGTNGVPCVDGVPARDRSFFIPGLDASPRGLGL